jgi:hypothetical protein
MGAVYTVSAAGFTVVNGVVTLIAAMPSATVGFEVLRVWVEQSANATSAQQRVQLGWKETAFQTVVSVTPVSHGSKLVSSGIAGDTTIAAGKCGYNASAEGAGAFTVVANRTFNVLNGFLWIPTPEERFEALPGASYAFTVYFPVAAVTLTNWCAGFTYREIR